MKETSRICGLFMNLYNGHPWLDVTIVDTLKTISWEQAGTKVHPHLNSIWQIVIHMVSWRQNVLRRVNGEVVKTPENNYIQDNPLISEDAWLHLLDELETSQRGWIGFLQNADDSILDGIYAGNKMSYYEQIHGIIQHDAYNLGQIVLLAKMLRNLLPA
jgi:uncharacterized damage-inducible protein DinB